MITLETQPKHGVALRFEPWERWGLGLAVGFYIAICLMTIGIGSPLGHDEALYATRAREFLTGDPAAPWFSSNRAPGLPLLLTLAWVGNGTEPYLRLVVALSGVVLIALTWLTARMMINRVAAPIAAFGVALTPIVIVSATQVWPDIPGAAAGMAALFLYGWGLSRPRFQGWNVLLVVACIVMATVIRFGAPLQLGVGFIALTLWRWPRDRDRWLKVAGVAVMGAVGVGLILMTPLVTGHGIPGQTISVGSADNPAFSGFGDYWTLRARLAAGPVAVGLLGVAIGLVRSWFDRDMRRLFVWPFVIAICTFIVISSVVHGESRYLSPFYPWFWIAASVGLAAMGKRMPAVWRTVLAPAMVVLFVLLAPALSDDAQEFNWGYSTIETAARSLADSGPCEVLTSYTPQVEWYSGCETENIDPEVLVVDSPTFPMGPRYLFIVENGKRQPDEALMEQYIEETTGEPQAFGPPGASLRYVEIWTLRR